jgi:O-acetyl-ADP-ribose deacetylase (regulator of RNase III)
MIQPVTGDLFQAHVDCVVDPTNARGVSGAGLAKAFALKYPAVAQGYTEFCKSYYEANKTWPIGLCYHQLLPKSDKPWGPKAVICLPTKDDWRRPSEPRFIQAGLTNLVEVMRAFNYKSVAMPALGCGLGGLSMSTVKPIIDRVFFGLELQVLLYAGKGDVDSAARPVQPQAKPAEKKVSSHGFQPVRPVLAGRA